MLSCVCVNCILLVLFTDIFNCNRLGKCLSWTGQNSFFTWDRCNQAIQCTGATDTCGSCLEKLPNYRLGWTFNRGPAVSELVVVGEVGQSITVPCTYSVRSTRDITSMCWGRGRCPNSQCSQTLIWTDGWKVTEQHGSRYLLQGNLREGDVSLTIVNAEEADSGIYCCRVEHRGWFNDQKVDLKVVIMKARISTASPHTYTSEQTSAPDSTSESSFTITDTWPSVSASEVPLTASGPCSGTSDCSDVTANLQNTSVSLPSQQYSENGLYIGIGSCAALLVILILALYLTKQYFYNTKKTGDFANFIAFQRPQGVGNHSALEDEIHAEENIYIIH